MRRLDHNSQASSRPRRPFVAASRDRTRTGTACCSRDQWRVWKLAPKKRSDGSFRVGRTKAPVQAYSELGVGTRMTSRQIGCLERDMGVVWENRALYNPVRSWSTREAIFVSGSYIVGWVG